METEMSQLDTFSLARFGRGAVDLFRSPKSLFQSMNKDGGYGKPILYALLWQYVAGAIALLVSFIRPLPTPWGVTGNFLSFFFMPPLTLLAGFIFSGVFFVIWHLMGSSHGYQTAFRVWALLAPLAVVSALFRLVPFLSLAVTLFYVFLLVVASVEVHAVRPTKAWTVWGGLLVLFLIVLVLVRVIGAVRGRLLSAQGVPSMPTFPSAPQFPAQSMTPGEIQKKIAADMARAKADFERGQKEPRVATPAIKKEASKK